MPSLILMKSPDGSTPNKTIELKSELMVIGREDGCQIVIPHHLVSRKHAQIVRSGNQFFIEDLKSRNKTFVNSKEVLPPVRQLLNPDDRIKICDFLFRFHDERVAKPAKLPDWMSKGAAQRDAEESDESGMTTIAAQRAEGTAQQFLEVAPQERLRVLLDISTSLARVLDLDPLLAQLADTLLGVYKQADRCFLIMLDESGRPLPKSTKTRRAAHEDTRFSRTIVKKVLDAQTSYLTEDASNDANIGTSVSIAEFKIRSVICAPLISNEGTPLGAIQLDSKDRGKKFVMDDLNLLTIVANLAGVAIEKARLHETVLTREKEAKEIELARKVQLGFLPQTLPVVEGYEFFSHYSPAQTVGGDYYDFITLPGGRVAVVLGDVAGKGVPAALLVAKLSSEVRFCLLTVPDLAEAACLLNEQMIQGGLGDRFVTLALMILDPKAHTVSIVNAGHMSPKLYKAATGELVDAISLDATGLPIGTLPGYPFEMATVKLAPGDSLAVFTDGVTDAMNQAGEMFGNDKTDAGLLPDHATAAEPHLPKAMGNKLVAAVRAHANGQPQNDDIAVVAFGRVDSGYAPFLEPPTGPIAPTGPVTGKHPAAK
jgi:serine phosphatase RsbU (regulator of sigma subunit)